MRRLTRVAALLLAVVGHVVSARAQSPVAQAAVPLRELSLEQLGALRVTTVAKQPSEVWRTPAAITVLTQDDIRRSGVTTLPELLRTVAGVQVSRLDSDHWAIGIRGLTSSFSKALLVLIDGRSVSTPLYGGVYWQVQQTLLEDIERIEVIRGPGGGNVDQGRVAMRYGATRGDALSYRVYATGSLRDHQYDRGGHPFDEWSLAQSGFRLDAGGAGDETLRLQGDIYRGTMGERVALGSFTPPSQLLVEGSDIVSGGNLVAGWDRQLPARTRLRLQAYYDRTVRDAIHYGEARNTFDVDVLLRTPIGRRHQLSWGTGARSSDSDVTSKFPTLTLALEDRNQRLASVYGQDEIALLPDELFATIGTKLEHNTYTGWEVQPSARLLWRIDTQETLWAGATRAVRTPSRIETDLRLTHFLMPSPLVYVQLAGSPAFDAEGVVGVEAGYRRLVTPSIYLDVTAFHNTYQNLASFSPFAVTVETAPIPHLLGTTTYENGIRATGDGFEIAPDWRPREWARLRGSYGLLSINAANRPGSMDTANVALYEGSVPRHQVSAQASITLPNRVEVDYVQRAVARLQSHDVPGYVTGDARVAWTIGHGLTLAATAQNLWAPNHVEFFRDEFPTPGIRRSAYVSVQWRR